MAYEDLFSGIQGFGSQYDGGGQSVNGMNGAFQTNGAYAANDPAAAASYRDQQLAAQGLVNDGTGNYYQPGYSQANNYMQGVQNANIGATANSGAFSGIQGGGLTGAASGGMGGASGAMGWPGASGFSSNSSTSFQQNPYLRDQMSALTGQYQQQFLQNTAPQLRANALASGQYGGSRQGIAEGIAQGNAATGLASALANLQAGTYQTDTSNALQGQSLANQYNLGMGQLGLGYGNLQNNANIANQNFYTSQRGQDLQQYGLGASLANQGLTGQTSVGQGLYNLGNVYQQAPMQALNTYSQALQPYTGYGQSNTTTSNTGGGFSGAAGGALAGMNIGNRIGNYMGGSGGYDPYSGSTGATNSSLMSLYGNGMG